MKVMTPQDLRCIALVAAALVQNAKQTNADVIKRAEMFEEFLREPIKPFDWERKQ